MTRTDNDGLGAGEGKNCGCGYTRLDQNCLRRTAIPVDSTIEMKTI